MINIFSWILAVYMADQYDVSDNDLRKTKPEAKFEITEFNLSRNEVEVSQNIHIIQHSLM